MTPLEARLIIFPISGSYKAAVREAQRCKDKTTSKALWSLNGFSRAKERFLGVTTASYLGRPYSTYDPDIAKNI